MQLYLHSVTHLSAWTTFYVRSELTCDSNPCNTPHPTPHSSRCIQAWHYILLPVIRLCPWRRMHYATARPLPSTTFLCHFRWVPRYKRSVHTRAWNSLLPLADTKKATKWNKYSKGKFSQNPTNLLSIKVATCFDSYIHHHKIIRECGYHVPTFSYCCKHFGFPKMCTFTWRTLNMVQ